MRYALIDNSSLTAVQRLMGHIPITNKYMIDADIVTFENYIQSILFYDKLLYLDDYKQEFKSNRRRYFNEMTNIELSKEESQELVKAANEITHDIVPNIEGGRINNKDITEFFEQLKMNLTFSWELNSSVYYLTTRILEDVGGLDLPKYSKLSQMIYSELHEKRTVDTLLPEKEIKIVDSKGNPITSTYLVEDKGGHSKETGISNKLLAFIAGINWLSFRTAYYTLAANSLNADLILHPIRQGFQLNLLSKLNILDNSLHTRVLAELNRNAKNTVMQIKQFSDPLILNQDYPMFVAWIAKKAGLKGNFIEVAYDLREDKNVIEARKKLGDLEDLLKSKKQANYVKDINRLILDVNLQMKRLCEKYKVQTAQGTSISNAVSLYNFVAPTQGIPSIPRVNFNLKGLDFLKDMIPKRGFSGLYRRVVNDLTKIERLGEYHDIISSRVRFTERADYYEEKTDQSKYYRSKSSWKLPL